MWVGHQAIQICISLSKSYVSAPSSTAGVHACVVWCSLDIISLEWVQRQVVQECSLRLISHSVTFRRSLELLSMGLAAQPVSTIDTQPRRHKRIAENDPDQHRHT